MRKIKYIKRQDSGFKLSYGNSGETSLNLSNEIFDFISKGNLGLGEEKDITFKIYKEDCIKAMSFIIMKLPLYKSSSTYSNKIENYLETFSELYSQIDVFFGNNKNAEYRVNLFYRTDGRIYLKGLRVNGFSIRDYLVENYSALQFDNEGDGSLNLRILSDIEDKGDNENDMGNQSQVDANVSILLISSAYRPYITAIKSKPFLLLAGISGTGKSRIVRELARACWEADSEEYKSQKPKNFAMIQVKPNWHDSSELIGYVSRVSGEPIYVAGDFLKFVAKAWENPEVPHFLCLDEMNLAPVEQYFAEYLSVVESRKRQEDGTVTTDPILKPEYEKERDEKTGNLVPKKWYSTLVSELLAECPPETIYALKMQFEQGGITIPQNLIVVGTVNMDETTFSFSRKVLDRAMTIEMNEVDLYGGLDSQYEKIGKLEFGNLIGMAVEGVDVYADNKEVCDKVISYLKAINEKLEGTPFKVAYRTRNEFLLYVVNNLPYNKDKDGNELEQNFVIARALDEITSMKILSRIEGDETKVSKYFLDDLRDTIKRELNNISQKEYSGTKDKEGSEYSVSLAKLKEMIARLESGYTSFWS